MSAFAVSAPFPTYPDINGDPLDNGSIYIGVAGLPAALNPINVYFDEALTQLAAQPIATRGGYPVNNGVRSRLFVNSDYSIQVLNSKGTMVYQALQSTDVESSDQVTFLQAGANAVQRTVQSKLRDVVSVRDFGAVGDGVTDDTAAFNAAGSSISFVEVEIPAGVYLLNSNPTPTGNVTWIVQKGASFTGTGTLSFLTNKIVSCGAYRSLQSNASFYNGIFGYLEQSSAVNAYGTIALNGVVQSSGGSGASGEADIAVAGFAAHNLNASVGGVWALYGTCLRATGVNGATHGLEIDVANFGSTVQITPANPFQPGLTAGAWICSGGETTEPSAGGSPGISSVGVAIIQNDSQVVKTAKFDKGIVFHNSAISGTDGATGNGVAIAFATRHQQLWFNNLDQVCGEVVANNTDVTKAYRLDFSQFGLLLGNRANGVDVFQVEFVVNAVNGVGIQPTVTGNGSSIIYSKGNDANLDFFILPKGTGLVRYGTYTSTGDVACNGYIEIKDAAGNVRKLMTTA